MAGTVNEIVAVVCPTVTLTSVTGYGTIATKKKHWNSCNGSNQKTITKFQDSLNGHFLSEA